MGLPVIALPCTKCGNVAVTFRPPEFDSTVRGIVAPLVKLSSLKFGKAITLPKSGNVFELIDPATLAELLELTCTSCAFPAALEMHHV